jgi:osmotically-inducible protein OsmY
MESTAMKQFKYISTIILAGMLTAMLGCASTSSKDDASTSKKESTGEYLDDSVITTKVKAAVLNEPTLKSFEIKVVTYKGVVQLSGFVSSEANIEKAVEVARGVKGVSSVKNDMRLKVK